MDLLNNYSLKDAMDNANPSILIVPIFLHLEG